MNIEGVGFATSTTPAPNPPPYQPLPHLRQPFRNILTYPLQFFRRRTSSRPHNIQSKLVLSVYSCYKRRKKKKNLRPNPQKKLFICPQKGSKEHNLSVCRTCTGLQQSENESYDPLLFQFGSPHSLNDVNLWPLDRKAKCNVKGRN